MTKELSELADRLKRGGFRLKAREFAKVEDTLIPMVLVRGSSAEAFSMAIRDSWRPGGLYPVILGAEGSWEGLAKLASTLDHSVSDLNREAEKADPAQILTQLGRDEFEDEQLEISPEELPAAPIPLELEFDPLRELAKEKVAVAFFPIQAPWQVFAWLGFGGWNSCPAPLDHCVLHRSWALSYKAEVVSVTHDSIALQLFDRPRRFSEAFEVAIQQYYYCPDVINQSRGGWPMHVAKILKGYPWQFWWD